MLRSWNVLKRWFVHFLAHALPRLPIMSSNVPPVLDGSSRSCSMAATPCVQTILGPADNIEVLVENIAILRRKVQLLKLWSINDDCSKSSLRHHITYHSQIPILWLIRETKTRQRHDDQ
uniref:Uncharacterized protein n=1 Tax=Entomoneis paludosa TaxID=265537 RepID=A0A7S2YBQ0_9STRA|mmetsp:Transcript_26323/g.55004  ORF Transcript_26323/g.55004 Transcript_26323/m.55004 type:complete len:119 (+) Transcript_26323:71-427(+)